MPTKQKQLQTVEPSDSLSDKLRAEVKRVMRAMFFDPLMSELKAIQNNATSKSKLVRGVESGKLQYVGGAFTGKLDAATGKSLKELGAKFDKRRRGWVIAEPRLPADLQEAVRKQVKAREALEQAARESIALISKRVQDMIPRLDFDPYAGATEDDVDDKVLASLADEIAIQPKLSRDQKAEMRKAYTENVKLSIVGFIDDEVTRFRKSVLPKIRDGMDRDQLRLYIQSRLKVSSTRAAFIARQETALFTSQQKQLLYLDAGVTRYKWKAIGGKAGDGRTRDSHAEAHGKIFYWDKPVGPNGDLKPVNSKGEPVNPSVDFGCRCQAIPIVEKIV